MIKYRVIKEYKSSAANPIRLRTGDKVRCLDESDPCGDWAGWVLCINQDVEGWVPSQIIDREEEFGVILADYDATEFDLKPGEIIISGEELNGWVWGHKKGKTEIEAWAPLNCLEKIFLT